MTWLKNIFKRKPKEYFYFKKVVNKFYGLCGCTKLYVRIEKETGSYSCMWNRDSVDRLKKKGFKAITRAEWTIRL